ncbi:protein of unknown function [Burkholderia multivorans]
MTRAEGHVARTRASAGSGGRLRAARDRGAGHFFLEISAAFPAHPGRTKKRPHEAGVSRTSAP